MLAPRDTATRERKSLDGLWRFALDTAGVGRDQGWQDGLPAGARQMPVPASYNDVFPEPEVHDHVGDVWYETLVRVPARWAGERIVLRFGSATHRAVVWVNGRQVAEHEGGYTPFEADVTGVVEPGAENRVTVVVNNVLTWQSIPPGYVEQTPDGPRQHYFHDFFNYAGLHRPVWLYTTPGAHITDVTVVAGLAGATGTVDYRVETAGADGLQVRVMLTDADGAEVARATGGAGQLTVPDARPWRPGEGYLYDLAVELWGDGDAPVDAYTLAIGIRTVEVDGARFLINGEPFYFRGFGKHEDSAVRGKGHDNVFMVHDFALMDWLGANSFRTSHYPYAEEVLEYADRRGIVVIDETPAVGLNMGLGGGIFGSQGFRTFSEDTINDATREVHRQVIRELIARDKNHPCVVVWSIANEPESDTPQARAYFEPLAAETRRLDPSRPVGLRQRDARARRQGRRRRPLRRGHAQPLLRLVRQHRRPARRRTRARGGAQCLGRQARQADHHDRVRRRHHPWPSWRHTSALDRGVPGRAAGDVAPGLRPGRRGCRRADLELRRLRHLVRGDAGGRQQEGCFHPRPAAQGQRPPAAAPLARAALIGWRAR